MDKSKLREMQKRSTEVFKEKYGSEGYRRVGKASAKSRNAAFKTEEEKKAYYSMLGKRSAAKKKAQKAAANSPLMKLSRLLSGK